MPVILLLLLTSQLYALTDREIIASTISMEARGEGDLGMLAVADVIVVRGNLNHQTAVQVCLAPHQFSCWLVPVPIDRLSKESESWAECLSLADAILNHVPIKNVTGSATHYCTASVSPSWADPTKITARIGHHVFYRLS